jgi:NADH:ubiquinone oxidoreductase subunit F (NADH-binding)
VAAAVARAVAERDDRGVRWKVTAVSGGFVGGQETAVLEHVAGRPNRPVTRWQPASVAARGRRPVVLSNAETFAQTAAAWSAPWAFTQYGTADEPGTTLVSIGGDGIVDRGIATVVEVEQRIPVYGVVPESAPGREPVGVLLGGYHGQWLRWPDDGGVPLSHLAPPPAPRIGAGVVLPLAVGGCPVSATAAVISYLSDQRVGQCGPCEFGLPTLAQSAAALATGAAGSRSAAASLLAIADLVDGRGACRHPDGTARLARSLVTVFGDDVDAHTQGYCLTAGRAA